MENLVFEIAQTHLDLEAIHRKAVRHRNTRSRRVFSLQTAILKKILTPETNKQELDSIKCWIKIHGNYN